MSKIREVMTRDGVVQTFLQIPDIHKVQFTVGGQPLTNSRNQEVGEMTSDTLRNIPEKTKKAIVMILLHCILRIKMEKSGERNQKCILSKISSKRTCRA